MKLPFIVNDPGGYCLARSVVGFACVPFGQAPNRLKPHEWQTVEYQYRDEFSYTSDSGTHTAYGPVLHDEYERCRYCGGRKP